MAGLKERFQQFERSLKTLEEAFQSPYSTLTRDATIQRFEYTFELFWKCLKEFLREGEGIVAASPKSVFREAMQVGILNEEETATCLQMTDDRNSTSHTYCEEIAEKIYRRIREKYGFLMREVGERIASRF